jgi:hypothetical protein
LGQAASKKFGKTEIFLQAGLDRANQIDPAQQIRFYAQIREALGWVEFAGRIGPKAQSAICGP